MFREYIDKKEEEKLNENILDTAGSVISTAGPILGIGAAGLLAAYGGSLIISAASGGIAGIIRMWQKIKNNFVFLKRSKPDEYIKKVKENELVIHEVQKQKENKREFDNVFGEIYKLIGDEKFDEALEEYNNLGSSISFVKRLPAAKQSIVVEITKVVGEPPSDLPSPGNKTYKIIKSFIGIREAKATCEAVRYNMKKEMENQDNIEGDN